MEEILVKREEKILYGRKLAKLDDRLVMVMVN